MTLNFAFVLNFFFFIFIFILFYLFDVYLTNIPNPPIRCVLKISVDCKIA